MSNDHQDGSSALFSYLRRPRFTASDVKKPRDAVLHALPAMAFISLPIWGLAFVIMSIFVIGMGLPIPVIAAITLIIAVPCLLASWAVAIRCIEVEARLKD